MNRKEILAIKLKVRGTERERDREKENMRGRKSAHVRARARERERERGREELGRCNATTQGTQTPPKKRVAIKERRTPPSGGVLKCVPSPRGVSCLR